MIIQCYEGNGRWLAWVMGKAEQIAAGDSAREAIGALVMKYPELFGVTQVNLGEDWE